MGNVFRLNFMCLLVGIIFTLPLHAKKYQGPLRLLIPELGQSRSITSYAVSADGQFVVYVADKDSDNDFELFVVPIEGGESTKLNTQLAVGADLDSFKISPSGDRVVYLADQNEANVTELFSVPIEGGTVVRLNDDLVENGDVLDFYFTPDGSRIVYLADQDEDEKIELYSVFTAGGDTDKLSLEPIISDGDVKKVVISPNSQYVAYSIDDELDEQYNIYSVNSEGGANTKLNNTLNVPVEFASDHRISFDSDKVVFLANEDDMAPLQLYSNNLSGGMPTRLNGNLVAGGSLHDFKLSPSDDSVVYRADQIEVLATELFLTNNTSPLISRINGSLTDEGEVKDYRFSSDGSYVVYLATELERFSTGIYSKSLTSDEPRIHLNGNDILNQFDTLRFGGFSEINDLFYVHESRPQRPNALWVLSLSGQQLPKKIFEQAFFAFPDLSYAQFEENNTLTETNASGTHAIFIAGIFGTYGDALRTVPLTGNVAEVNKLFPLPVDPIADTLPNFSQRTISSFVVAGNNTVIMHASYKFGSLNERMQRTLYAVDNVGLLEPLCLSVKTKINKFLSYCI